MPPRPSFRDIISGRTRLHLDKVWENTAPAQDLEPIPTGSYTCRVVQGEPFEAQTGTPGFKLTFEVLDGEHVGRRVWHTAWFTPAAMSYTKRDLAKLGIHQLSDLDRPFPTDRIVQARVGSRSTDDGHKFNVVGNFELVTIEPIPADPFAPVEPSISEDTRTTEQQEGGSIQ